MAPPSRWRTRSSSGRSRASQARCARTQRGVSCTPAYARSSLARRWRWKSRPTTTCPTWTACRTASCSCSSRWVRASSLRHRSSRGSRRAGRPPSSSGRARDAEVRRVWDSVRGARDAAVELLRARWAGHRPVTGAELDDAARGVIRDAGYAAHFPHRTGHSIDRELHGSGPHLDNFETADTRGLIPGVGFSVEPGVYFPGRFGMRSEINVFLAETGPEVT